MNSISIFQWFMSSRMLYFFSFTIQNILYRLSQANTFNLRPQDKRKPCYMDSDKTPPFLGI